MPSDPWSHSAPRRQRRGTPRDLPLLSPGFEQGKRTVGKGRSSPPPFLPFFCQQIREDAQPDTSFISRMHKSGKQLSSSPLLSTGRKEGIAGRIPLLPLFIKGRSKRPRRKGSDSTFLSSFSSPKRLKLTPAAKCPFLLPHRF